MSKEGVRERLTVKIEINKELLPVLKDSSFIYDLRQLGLTPDYDQQYTILSVKSDRPVFTSITQEERDELIRLFKSLVHSLEYMHLNP